jgi:hypothetical protein
MSDEGMARPVEVHEELHDPPKADYTISLSYGYGSVDEMLLAFAAEAIPLNAKDIALEWTGMPDVRDDEAPRVFGTAVLLHVNTPDNVTFWDCLYVAWIFERG